MKNKKIGINFDLKFDNLTDLNPSFAAGRVAIAYSGRNRNRSDISKEVFEKALPSLANCPLVGRFDAEAEDFGSHDVRVKVNDAGTVAVEAATTPFGVVPETMNASWQEVTEEDGTVREYLFCNVILWKRQPGYECLASQGVWHQSMEINVDQYVIDKDGYCVIEDMNFEALCILGNSVEPCFESASVQIGTNVAVSDYKAQFALMLEELRAYYSDNNKTEGGEDSLTEEKKFEILAKHNLKIEDLNFEISAEMTEEEFEAKVAEFANANINNNGEGDPENVPSEQMFSATYNQRRDALRNALDPEIVRDGAGKLVQETYYYLVDFDDEYVYVEKDVWNAAGDYESTNGRFSYTYDDETATASITGEFERMILRWLTEEENAKLEQSRTAFEALSNEFSEYKETHSYDNDAYDALNSFKMATQEAEHKKQVDEILERFAELAENEEFKALSETAYDFSDLSDLEKECYAIKGKMSMAFSKPAKKQTAVRVVVSQEHENNEELYGGLFAKYSRKK